MNHDYSHCLDFNDSCPKKCFRAELVRDLRSRKDMIGVPVSWTHYKGTDECRRWKERRMRLTEYSIKEVTIYVVVSEDSGEQMDSFDTYEEAVDCIKELHQEEIEFG